MKMMLLLSLIAMLLLLTLKVTLGNMTTYASTNVTANNATNQVPNLISAPPPSLLSSSSARTSNASGNNTAQMGPSIQEKTSRNNTGAQPFVYTGPQKIIKGKPSNVTALATEGPRQIITGKSNLTQLTPQNQPGQNIPNTITGNQIQSIPNMSITKEQAAKAEQQANVMLKAYYEKVNQQKTRAIATPAVTTGNTSNTTMTKNSTSQLQQELQAQQGQQPITEDNSTSQTPFSSIGIPGIP